MAIKPLLGELFVVITTEADENIAKNLAKEILGRRFAACVSLTEINSYFWWEEKTEQNNEVQLLIKTTKNKLDNLLELINKLHSYQTPELLYWKVTANNPYIEWAEKVTNVSFK